MFFNFELSKEDIIININEIVDSYKVNITGPVIVLDRKDKPRVHIPYLSLEDRDDDFDKLKRVCKLLLEKELHKGGNNGCVLQQ